MRLYDTGSESEARLQFPDTYQDLMQVLEVMSQIITEDESLPSEASQPYGLNNRSNSTKATSF